MKVTIPSSELIVKSGNDNGRQWTQRKQPIWIHFPDKPFPTEIHVTIADGKQPFPPGEFELDAEASLYVNRQGKLACFPVLKSKAPQKSATA